MLNIYNICILYIENCSQMSFFSYLARWVSKGFLFIKNDSSNQDKQAWVRWVATLLLGAG